MNADGTIYGRYGSRSSQKEATRELSLEGFRATLAAGLELHKAYPANRIALRGKRGGRPRFPVPERYPDLRKYKSTLDYQGKVAQSCMHCHMVQAAERKMFRAAGKPIPDRVLYPWPMPDLVGLTLDPNTTATVSKVAAGSAAARAGFRSGDRIISIDRQPIISIADVQWVLHNAGDRDGFPVEVQRGGRRSRLALSLSAGWRRRGEISWRTTTWDLRRMATGGLLLEDLPAADRRRLRLKTDVLALRVKHVGQFGAHAAAKRAGFRKGDIIVRFDGLDRHMTETELIARGVTRHRRGVQIPVTVLRAGKRLALKLPMQ